MFNWLKYALDWLKTPVHYFLPLLAASSFGLFAPLRFMKFLGIEYWRAEGKPYLGSVFVISLAIVGCHYASEIIKWLVNKYRMFLSLRAAQASLKSLTPDEKEFLSGYLKKDSLIQTCWIHNSVAAVLRSKGILYVAVEKGMTDNFPFTIYPWVWEYLKKNPHLVEIERIDKHKMPLKEKKKI